MSYGHQAPAIERIGAFLKADPSGALIVAPPGTGKGNLLADAARMNNGRSLVLAHRTDLVTQLAERVRKFAPELTVGVEMGDGKADPDADVIVASVQTTGRKATARLQGFDFTLVLTDEAHRAAAPSYRRTVERLAPKAHHLGFTATPTAAGTVPLLGHELSPYQSILWEYGIIEAVESGALCDLRGWVVRTQEKLDRVRITGGDFNVGELAEAIDTEIRTAACFKAWADLAVDRRTVAFCANVAHAQSVAEFFRSQHVSAAAVWGTMPKDDRIKTVQAFRDGRIRVLTNCNLIVEGIDIPAVDCILMMRPTKSRTLFVQSIGRGMRTHPGKDHCVVIDVVDATKRNDLVTLSAFAGLPSKTDLQGETFLDAWRESEKLDLPESLRVGEMTLAELRMRATEVRLLERAVGGYALIGRPPTVSAHIYACQGCGKELRAYPKSVYKNGAFNKYCSMACKRESSSLIGKRFGRLQVVEETKGKKAGVRSWVCLCDCGTRTTVATSTLTNENGSRSCGCLRREKAFGPRVDLTGNRCGRLTVLGYAHYGSGEHWWRCQCSCGREKAIRGESLRNATTTSCGCLQVELLAKLRVKPMSDLDGVQRPIKDIAKRVGMKPATLYSRLKQGMSLDSAIAKPVRGAKNG